MDEGVWVVGFCRVYAIHCFACFDLISNHHRRSLDLSILSQRLRNSQICFLANDRCPCYPIYLFLNRLHLFYTLSQCINEREFSTTQTCKNAQSYHSECVITPAKQ